MLQYLGWDSLEECRHPPQSYNDVLDSLQSSCNANSVKQTVEYS